MGGIFINYRTVKDDPRHIERVKSLRDALEKVFGKGSVFLDFESLDAGSQYGPSIRERLAEARIVLAVIHPGWRATLLERGPGDWVREELRSAFDEIKRDRAAGRPERKLVIPVLVGGATDQEWTDLPVDVELLGYKQARRFDGTPEGADALAEELTLHYDDEFEQWPAEEPGLLRVWLRRYARYLVGAAAVVGVAGGLAVAPLWQLATVVVPALVVLLLASGVSFMARKKVTSAEAVVQPMSWRDYNLRVAVPFAVGWVAFMVFLLIGVTDPGLVGFVLSAFVLLSAVVVTVLLLKTWRGHQLHLRRWPVELATPVRPSALRADMARLDLKLGEWEGKDARLPFGLRVRCRVALGDIERGLGLIERDRERGRVAWALADHPGLSAAVVLVLALTAGSVRFHPVIAGLAVGLAVGAAELAYRRQWWVRRAVAREVRDHIAELRSRWTVLDQRRS